MRGVLKDKSSKVCVFKKALRKRICAMGMDIEIKQLSYLLKKNINTATIDIVLPRICEKVLITQFPDL